MGDPSSKRVDVAQAGTVTSAPFLSASRGLEVAEGKLRIVEEEVLIEQKARLAAEAENVRLREALTELCDTLNGSRADTTGYGWLRLGAATDAACSVLAASARSAAAKADAAWAAAATPFVPPLSPAEPKL